MIDRALRAYKVRVAGEGVKLEYEFSDCHGVRKISSIKKGPRTWGVSSSTPREP